MHTCNEHCARLGLTTAHERVKQRMRVKRLAKLRGRRPRIRKMTTTHADGSTT